MNVEAKTFLPVLPGEVLSALPGVVSMFIGCLQKNIQKQDEKIQQQDEQIQQQDEQIQQLQALVYELEAKLAKDSTNSGKPPSSDGLKRKPKSLRVESDKKKGAQDGHAGKNLESVRNPDTIVMHTPTSCGGCGSSLAEANATCMGTRQVFDIPPIKIKVTEHRIEGKECLRCGKLTKGEFPENVKSPVQYGDQVRTLVAYFSNQHFIPVKRVCDILKDVFGTPISPGTCANIEKKLSINLTSFEEGLKTHLLGSHTLHFDETGMRCKKKLHWVHVAASNEATLYTMHEKRGKEAIEAAGILPNFTGVAVHDYWVPYFGYTQATHALCNAHHARELIFAHEHEKEKWAKPMLDHLIQANKEVEKYIELGALPHKLLEKIKQEHKKLLADGMLYHASLPSPVSNGTRGRKRQRYGKNLLDRLDKKSDCVLRFTHDFSVPFTNNLAERDIRMVKVKQKVSGCFRTSSGGDYFCRVRSYISTARKQKWNVLDSLLDAVRGMPRLLQQEASGQPIVA